MRLRCSRLYLGLLVSLMAAVALPAQTSLSSSSSHPHPSQTARKMGHPNPSVDAGSMNGGAYRSRGLGFSCKIPAAWVLRTEDMNVQDEEQSEGSGNADPKGAVAQPAEEKNRASLGRTAEGGCPHTGSCGRVLLAAFSRPPEAAGEDVNSSILIVAESVAAYPGLREAAQYLGPVSEVAKAQGFKVVEEPYEFAVGTKKLVREDFQKDVGTRVMRQSTLVMLARGYVVSFTFIGGTEGDVEELVRGLSFGVGGNISRSK